MARVWITYAWEDNKDLTVDFIAQELIKYGLDIKLDRWNIGAGKRLWEQIENFIRNPNESDAWILYATQNSLNSEPCKEEYYYALNRAISIRGNSYPIIGLFPSTTDDSLIPAGISSRLFVSINDPDWKERIKAAAENRSPRIGLKEIAPYSIDISPISGHYRSKYVIEVRPRAGSWSPFFAAIPINEKIQVDLEILHNPRGRIPMNGGMLLMGGEGTSKDGNWYTFFAQNEATPTQSYFIFCRVLPSKISFGVMGGKPQYLFDLSEISNKPIKQNNK